MAGMAMGWGGDHRRPPSCSARNAYILACLLASLCCLSLLQISSWGSHPHANDLPSCSKLRAG